MVNAHRSRGRQHGSARAAAALIVAMLGLSGCAALQPGLARDWTETSALVATRAERGGYLEAGHALMNRAEYDLALRAYIRAIGERGGVTGPVIGGMGAANLQLDRARKARALLERGSRVAPLSPSVWNNFGVALASAGESNAAREAVGIAGSFAPENPIIAFNLARLRNESDSEPPEPVSLPVRHRSGLYLLLEGGGSDKDGDDNGAT